RGFLRSNCPYAYKFPYDAEDFPRRNVTTRHFFEKKNSKNLSAVARLSSREARELSFNIYSGAFWCFCLSRVRHVEMKCAMVTHDILMQERHPGGGWDDTERVNVTNI